MSSGKRILLVDNESAVLGLARQALERADYAVLATSDPAEANAILENPEIGIDLLLTDVFMPVITGPELARKAIRTRPRIRVLFMSGDPTTGRSHFRPEDQLLHKPFRITELLGRVAEVLSSDHGGIAGAPNDGGNKGGNKPEGEARRWDGTERRRGSRRKSDSEP